MWLVHNVEYVLYHVETLAMDHVETGLMDHCSCLNGMYGIAKNIVLVLEPVNSGNYVFFIRSVEFETG